MASPSANTAAWVSRLERRLTKLADTASIESIQALSKWIGFRRMHAKEFSASLASAIADPTSLDASVSNRATRQWLYLRILHESIILDSGTSRWDRLAEMREILGEFCMMEVAKEGCLDAATIKKVEGLVKEWDGLNVFGGPTLISMIKKQLTAPSKEASTSAPVEPKSPPRSPKRERSSSPKPTEKKQSTPPPSKPEEKPKEATPKPTSSTASAAPTSSSPLPPKPGKKNVEYDFESKKIPFGKVEAKQFLAPCKAIATLQIARDLRNDNAVQVSSLLKALPGEMKELADEADEEVKESGKAYELPEKRARELSVKTSERLLDMDIQEQLQNVRTFVEVVEKQREARQRIIHLLIRSRCRFGAADAAEAFYNLEKTQVELQKRKDTVLDAMELEGLDFEEGEEETEKAKKKNPELAPLTWYLTEKQGNGEPPAKKVKVDETK